MSWFKQIPFFSKGPPTPIPVTSTTQEDKDQRKAKFERCTTIEEKLEWIKSELSPSPLSPQTQRSPGIDGIRIMLEGILSRLKDQENFFDGDRNTFSSTNVREFLNEFLTMTDIQRVRKITLWLKIVRPFNITELLENINETETAAKMLEGQDVVMFLGASQSGKSTTIHYLAGSKFSRKGNVLEIREKSKHVNVESVETGSGKFISCTRFINPVKIPVEALNSLGVVPGSYTRDGIILCDAPGFGDTKGAEIDISNGIGITRALKKCRSVKFLLVFSNQVGDTGDVLKQIVKTVGSMFKDIKGHLDAFSYIFTKWDDYSRIQESLSNILNSVTDVDSPLYQITDHMVLSVEDKIHLVKPWDEKPAEILNMVLSKTSKIENTKETFQDFVPSKDSLSAFTQYCGLVEKSIRAALDYREVSVTTKKMKQLCEINKTFETIEGIQAQQQCARAICDHLDKVQSSFHVACDRICDPSSSSVSETDKESLLNCCEEAIDLETVLQYVERETLIPRFATRLEKLTMEFCKTFRDIFPDLQNSRTAESEHITTSDLSITSAMMEKAYYIKDAFLSNRKLSDDNHMKETISFICKQYELMESDLHLRCQFFTNFMVSENVHSDSLPKLLTLLDRMTEMKSLVTSFPRRVKSAHIDCLEETTAAFIQRFRTAKEDASAISKDMQELYLMDTSNLRHVVERLRILSSLAENPRICSILTTEQVDMLKECMKTSSEALLVLSTNLMSFLTSLLPSSGPIQVMKFAEVQKFSSMLAICDPVTLQKFTTGYNRYMASCSQCICDGLKCLELNESVPIDIDILRAAFINLSTAFEESEAQPYLTHCLGVFKDIVHRLKEYISKVSFDSMGCSVFKRLYKITEIEKIPLFGYEGAEKHDYDALKSSIADEIKDIRSLYETGLMSVEKTVLHVLDSEAILDYDFKTIMDSLSIVSHLPHGSTAAHHVQSFITFINQKLPSYWAEIKEAFNATTKSGGDDIIASMKSQLNLASIDWAQTINKLVSWRDQFATYSASFPQVQSEVVELFDTLPMKIVSTSIREALIFIAECKHSHLEHPLIPVEGRRWVDFTSTRVTMWVDPILSNGSLLEKYKVADGLPFVADGLSFRLLSDSVSKKLIALAQDLKSEISFATSAKKWTEVSNILKAKKDDLSTADLEEVKSDLAKVVQEEFESLLASTEIYSSLKFLQIFEESLKQLETIRWAHTELSSLVSITVIDASKVAACEKNIQNLIQKRIDDSFDTLLEKKSFLLLEEYVQSLEDIRSKLSLVSMPCHLPDCEHFGDYNSSLSQIISSKEKQFDDALLVAYNFITEQDISQYYLNPPSDVMDALKACENLSSLRVYRYQSLFQELKESILNQYACFLYIDLSKREVNKPTGTSFEQYEEVYRQATDSRSHIPRDFLSDVTDLCNLAEKVITQQKSSLEIERISYDLPDLPKYISIFQRHCFESNFNHAKVMKANIEKLLASQIKEIDNRLDDKDFMHAIDHFSSFLKHLMLYDKALGELNDNLISITTRPFQIHEMQYEVSRNSTRSPNRKPRSVISYYYVVINGKRVHLPRLTPDQMRTKQYHHALVHSEGRTEELELYSKIEITRKGSALFERMEEIFNTSVTTLGNRFDISLQIVVKFVRSASVSNGEPMHHLKKLIDLQEEKIKSGLEKLNQIIESLSRKAENILKGGSAAELKRLLDTCKESEDGFAVWDDFVVASSDFAPYLSTSILPAKMLRYRDLQTRICGEFYALLDDAMSLQYHTDGKCTTPNETDRNTFYEKVNSSYQFFQNVDLLVDHLNIPVVQLLEMKKRFRDHITSEIYQIVVYLEQLKDELPSISPLSMSMSSIRFDNFRAIEESFTDITVKKEAKEARERVQAMFFSKFKSIQRGILEVADLSTNSTTSDYNTKVIVEGLVQLKTMSDKMSCFRLEIDKVIDGSLTELRKGYNGVSRFSAIALHIQNCIQDSSGGEHVKSLLQHHAFDQISTILRNKKTKTFTIFNVLGLQLDGNSLVECKVTGNGMSRIQSNDITLEKRVELYKQYKRFDDLYWETVERGITKRDTIKSECISSAKKNLASKTEEPLGDKICTIMCYIFAYWTLHRYTGKMTPSTETQNSRDALVQPHPAQIVAIFRLLSVHDNRSAHKGAWPVFEKHLVQVGTGEGKSVILAVTSILLSLLGYNVDCACYSSYLSKRDFEDFEFLFKAFDVLQFIKYGTFGSLCEDVININGNLREVVESIVSGRTANGDRPPGSARPRVLLIDEVDTFFSSDYYGKLYIPTASIDNDAIRAMAEWLWKHRDEKLYWTNVLKSSEFQNCLMAFPLWTDLITEVVKGMLFDLKTVTSSGYQSGHICLNDKIAYKDQDTYNDKIIRRYQTMFIYLKEYDSRNVSKQSMLKSLVGRLYCGGFSYAEIPHIYEGMMGVTGTLKHIVDGPDGPLLLESKISKFTYMPSVYGTNKLIFAHDSPQDVAIVSSKDEYFIKINEEIEARIKSLQAGLEYRRAVFVFFKDLATLDEFYNHDVFVGLKGHAVKLTEMVFNGKEGIIRSAASSGNVVLMTKAFGRGTDFICNDDRMIDAGGVHVIQTFLSEQKAEEVQIMGRTARQGNKGSFGMVLLDSDLVYTFGITLKDIESIKASKVLYSKLDSMRNDNYNEKLSPRVKNSGDSAKVVAEDFKESTAFLNDALAGRVVQVNSFLMKYNKVELGGFAEPKKTRLVVLMDATGSMGPFLQLAKGAVKQLFQNLNKIVTESGSNMELSIQYMVYRNYNAPPEKLLVESHWEVLSDNPSRLFNFMDSGLFNAEYGIEEEAVEVGFARIVEEDAEEHIDQVVLIGDAAANPVELVECRRNANFSGYAMSWRSTRFEQPVNYRDEMEKLKAKNISVSTFYLSEDAKKNFEEIAKYTGGGCFPLDVNDAGAAKNMTDVVAQRGLRAGGEELVSAYRKTFAVSKAYIA